MTIVLKETFYNVQAINMILPLRTRIDFEFFSFYFNILI